MKNLNNLLGLNIRKIYLDGNPFIKDIPDYKNKLFEVFLSLISIDKTDKEGNNVESTEYDSSDENEKIQSKCYNEKIDKNEDINRSKNSSEDMHYLAKEIETNSLNDEEEEEEEEEDDLDENSDNNISNK